MNISSVKITAGSFLLSVTVCDDACCVFFRECGNKADNSPDMIQYNPWAHCYVSCMSCTTRLQRVCENMRDTQI